MNKYTPEAEHKFRVGQKLIYSDFGLRSLVIVKVLPYKKRGHDPIGKSGLATPSSDPKTSVRVVVINNSLYNWDIGGVAPNFFKNGAIMYIYHLNLFRRLSSIIEKQRRVLYPYVLSAIVNRLKKNKQFFKVLVYYRLSG